MTLTDCCGATDRETTEDGPSYEDIGICPDCKDHCEFVSVCDDCSEEECVCDIQPTVIPVTRDMVTNLAIGILCAFATAALIAAPWLFDNADLAWRTGR